MCLQGTGARFFCLFVFLSCHASTQVLDAAATMQLRTQACMQARPACSATRRVMSRYQLMSPAGVLQMSSAHITFSTEADWKAAARVGWMSQMDLQYHWQNQQYATFDDFLAQLKQSKRKSIRQERKSIAKQGLRVARLRGEQITDEVWERFFKFYMDTTGARLSRAVLRECMLTLH